MSWVTLRVLHCEQGWAALLSAVTPSSPARVPVLGHAMLGLACSAVSLSLWLKCIQFCPVHLLHREQVPEVPGADPPHGLQGAASHQKWRGSGPGAACRPSHLSLEMTQRFLNVTVQGSLSDVLGATRTVHCEARKKPFANSYCHEFLLLRVCSLRPMG